MGGDADEGYDLQEEITEEEQSRDSDSDSDSDSGSEASCSALLKAASDVSDAPLAGRVGRKRSQEEEEREGPRH